MVGFEMRRTVYNKYAQSFLLGHCAQEFDSLQLGSDPSLVRGLMAGSMSCIRCNVSSDPKLLRITFGLKVIFFLENDCKESFEKSTQRLSSKIVF